MAAGFSRVLGFLLWISLLIFVCRQGWFGNFVFRDYGSYSDIADKGGRRALASEFDFTPFLKHKPSFRWKSHRKISPPVYFELDPRFGDEKRLVPSGPNPLHH